MSMAAIRSPSRILFPCVLLLIRFTSQSSCQSDFPRNIQTFYPFGLPPIGRTPNSTNNERIPPPSPAPPSPPPHPSQPSAPKSSSNNTVVKAVAATAASSLVISALFFFLLHRHKNRRRSEKLGANFNPVVPHNDEFVRFNGNIKGLIVDENGLDVLYWKKLEAGDNFNKEIILNNKGVEEEAVSKGKQPVPVHELPLLRGKSSTSQSPIWIDESQIKSSSVGKALKAVDKQYSSTRTSPQPPIPVDEVHQESQNSSEPPSSQPPPPPIPSRNNPLSHSPPPPPPISSCLNSNTRPPPPKEINANDGKLVETSAANGATRNGSNQQVKLKPLHWDKVSPNVDHSMVWDKVNGGSFR